MKNLYFYFFTMNKISYLAIAIVLVTPSILFASSDSWSFGASNAGSSQQASGMGAGKVAMQDMHVMREIGRAHV